MSATGRRSGSIRARLTAIILAGTAAAAALYAGVLVPREASARRRAFLERTEVAARLVGEYAVAPLAFGDLEGARRVLSRAGGLPAVTHAKLYDEAGKELAAFDRPEAPPVGGDRPAIGSHRFAGGTLVLALPVAYEGATYGSLVVHASTAELDAQLREGLAVAAAAFLAVLAVSWWLARRLHGSLSRRILALAGAMDRVSRERDYSVRVDVSGTDELGTLGRGLNEMLDEIQLHQREREDAQARLARLGTAVEHAGDEVLITDAQGMIQYVNPEFTRASGFTSDEAVGGPIPGTAEATGPNAEFAAALRSGRAWQGRIQAPRKDGSVLTADATVSPIPGPSGELLGFVVVRRDVTDRLRMERQLGQTQKLEALGTLAGGIAHDFNNILTGMIGLTEAARSDAPRGSPMESQLDEVLRGGQRAAGLVRKILTFGRRSESDREAIALGPIVQEALDLLGASLPSSITVKAELDPAVGVHMSATELHQVVMNLGTNAGLAMRERGGTLTVTLRAAALDEGFVRSRAGKGGGLYAVLTVADTGPGIDPAVRDRIFEPFFTTRPVGEGTGLGLSVVHGIVSSLGGFVTVHSRPGEGATFGVYLPAAPVPRAEAKAPAGERVRGGTERVLVVDDEPVLVRVATRALTLHGYRVTGATRGDEALATFRSDPSSFDVVVTDLTMPGLSGEELARRLKELRPDLPVVLCSGFGERMDAAALRAAGIDACAAKPYTAEGLAAAVREVLDAAPRPRPAEPPP
jgi:PAS domain S-box-containing protein